MRALVLWLIYHCVMNGLRVGIDLIQHPGNGGTVAVTLFGVLCSGHWSPGHRFFSLGANVTLSAVRLLWSDSRGSVNLLDLTIWWRSRRPRTACKAPCGRIPSACHLNVKDVLGGGDCLGCLGSKGGPASSSLGNFHRLIVGGGL